jgi:hypothetical protein
MNSNDDLVKYHGSNDGNEPFTQLQKFRDPSQLGITWFVAVDTTQSTAIKQN